jgi:hypothetical protein
MLATIDEAVIAVNQLVKTSDRVQVIDSRDGSTVAVPGALAASPRNRDYYAFRVDDNDAPSGYVFVWIVSKPYYRVYRAVEDRSFAVAAIDLPPGFTESMEAQYEFHGTVAAAKVALETAGFTWLDDPDAEELPD